MGVMKFQMPVQEEIVVAIAQIGECSCRWTDYLPSLIGNFAELVALNMIGAYSFMHSSLGYHFLGINQYH